jgi:tetratricopeptide (TPR) repeat protein
MAMSRFVIACAVALAALLACQSAEDRLADHMKRAQGYFESESWNEAKIEYMNVLQLDPENADAHFKLGEVLWSLQEYAEARWQYKEAGRIQPDNLEYRLRLAQVESLFQRVPEALDHANFILKADPNHVEALLIRGTLYSIQGDLEAFLKDVDRALEIEPGNAIGLRLRARGMEAKQDFAAAEVAYRKLVEAENNVSNRTLFALFLQTLKRSSEALEQLQKAVEVAANPDEKTQARVVVSSFHLNRGDIEEAEKELLKAKEEDPDNEALLTALARFYAAQGQEAQAEQMLEERAKLSPDNPEPLLALGEFHRRGGNVEKALDSFNRALAIDPQNEGGRLRKAELLREMGEKDPERAKEARALLAQVLEENPGSVRAIFSEGKFLLMDGNNEEAAARLRRVIDEQPRSNAHLLLGVAYVRMGQLDLARSEFLRATQLDADNVLARVQLAAIYQRMGEHELAAEEAQTALKNRRRDVRSLLVLAEANQSLGRNEQAIAALDKIRFDDEDAQDPQVRIHAARMYRQLGKPERATELLAEGLQKDPNNLRLLGEQVLGDIASRDPKAALERLNKAIEQHPDSALLYGLRGRVYMGFLRGNELIFAKEAEADLKKSIELDPSSAEPYATLAQLYRQTNRMQEAVDAYMKAAQADPSNANAHLVLGTLYEQAGQPDKAMAEYELAIKLDPKGGIAQNNLAWLIAQGAGGDREKLDRALKLAQDARELLPADPSVADTLGWVMLQRQVPTAAISLFREAMDGYPPAAPERGIVRYHLAKAYEANGERERAIEELEKALAETASFPNRSEAEELLKQLKAS